MRGDRDILVVEGKEGGGRGGGGLFDVLSRGAKKNWTSVHLVRFSVCCFFSLLDDSWLDFFYVRWCLRYSFFLP